MKDYKKLMSEYERGKTTILQHEWGQNKFALHNLVVKVWNKSVVGDKIVITSYKHFGIKSTVKFLNEKGISCSVVGKGPARLRVVECEKTTAERLPLIEIERTMEFEFRGTKYQVDVGDASFSRTGLDEGTRCLLEAVFEKGIDLNDKDVADFGAGWGAISLILANEFPKSRITAFETDDASFEASRNNLQHHPNVSVVNADLTKIDSAMFVEKRGNADFVISNPPFHSTLSDKELIFENASNSLKPSGELFFVAEKSFAARFREVAQNLFTVTEEIESRPYTVFWCRKK